jgi:hypothetical protein
MSIWAERTALREEVAILLAELGGTGGEVAAFLSAMGVQVRSSTPADSPAARYLHAVIGADTRVEEVKVARRRVTLRTSHRIWRTVRLRLPDPVRDFVASIDDPTTEGQTPVPSE